MENMIGLKELRENMNTYISQIKKGKSFIIVKRSKPIFKVSPLSEESKLWEPVVDFTKIRKGGINIDDLLLRL